MQTTTDLTSRRCSFDDANALYVAGLREVLTFGESVPSVLDPLSPASSFGTGDRPYRELRGVTLRLADPNASLVGVASPPINYPYLFAYMSWFLSGRNDLSTLQFYRSSAASFSDDGATLCGSFGHRIFQASGDQIMALCQRFSADPANRRLYVPIIAPSDNFAGSREYPCAAGLQLFVRDGQLHQMVIMRAQQALTILPYDLSIFCLLQLAIASEAGLEVGDYVHFAGTFGFYQDEVAAAAAIVAGGPTAAPRLPEVPMRMLSDGVPRLVKIETELREAVLKGDRKGLAAIARQAERQPFLALAKAWLVTYASHRLRLSAPDLEGYLLDDDWRSLLLEQPERHGV